MLKGLVSDDGLPNSPRALTVQWTKVSGFGTVGFTPPDAPITTVTFSHADTYVLRLTVSDGMLTSSDDVTVVVEAPNQPPLVELIRPLADADIEVEERVTLEADATDRDGTIRQVEFFVDEASRGIDATPPFSVTWTPTVEGDYHLTAKATDDGGKSTTSPPVRIIVQPKNQPPWVDPGKDQTITAITLPIEVELQGNAGDDGRPRRYLDWEWRFKSGPAPVTFSNPKAWRPMAHFTAFGHYVIELSATDGKLTGTGEVSVTLRENTPPFVNWVEPKANSQFTAPATIILKVTAADSDGTIQRVAFFRDGTTLIGETTQPESDVTYAVRWAGVGAETYRLTATATDNHGAQRTSNPPVTITVVPPNQPPIARVNAPTRVSGTTLVVLDGSGSSDPEGQALTYRWTQLDGPQVTLTNAISTQPSFVAPTVPTDTLLRFRLVVNDGTVDSNPAEASLTVSPPPNQPPQFEPLPDRQGKEGELLTFVVQVSDGNHRPEQLQVQVVEPLPKGATFATATRTFSWQPSFDQGSPEGKPYSVTFVVQDPQGASTSKSVTITVMNVNRPPEARWIAPADGTVLPTGSTVVLEAAATDADGQETIAHVTFLANGQPIGTATASPYRFSWTNVPRGVYRLSAEATDKENAKGVSAAVTAKVHDKPIAKISAPPRSRPGETVLLDGRASSDPEGATLTYQWSQTNGPSVSLDNPTSGQPSFRSPAVTRETSLTFRLIVSDGSLTSEPATISHVIEPAPPLLEAIPDQTVNEGDTFELNLAPIAKGFKLELKGLPDGTRFDDTQQRLRWQPTYEQAGRYPITVIATDEQTGLKSEPRTFTILVTDVNQPPRFEGLTDKTVKENELLEFVVRATDPDPGQVLRYRVQGEMPRWATFNDTTQTFRGQPTFDQGSPKGTPYPVTFRVEDGAGGADTKSLTLTVFDVNRRPEAKIHAPSTAKSGQPVTLDGSASSDRDGDPLTYRWSQPPGQTVALESTTGPTTSFLAPVVVTSTPLQFVLVVSDGTFDSDPPASVTVTVHPVPPVLPAFPEVRVKEGEILGVTLPAKEGLELELGERPEGLTFEATTRTVRWQPTYDQGRTSPYELSVTAYDPQTTLRSPSQTLRITVENVNRPPTVSRFLPPEGQVLLAPAAFDLIAEVNDPDSDPIREVVFFQNGQRLGADTTNEYRFAVKDLPPGTYTFTVVAIDAQGAQSDPPAQTKIDVKVNQLPVFEPIPPRVVRPDQRVSFTVHATDPDGKDATAALTYGVEDSRPGATFDAATQTFTWTPTVADAGRQSVTFTVTDRPNDPTRLVRQPATLVVNRPPVLSAVPDLTGLEGTRLTSTFMVTDPDGDRLKVELLDRPTGSSFDADARVFSWTPDFTQAREYGPATLRVTEDGLGLPPVERSFKITIQNVNRRPTIQPLQISPAPPYVAGGNLYLSVAASDPDGDETIARVKFFANDQFLGEDVTAPYTYEWRNVDAGTYKLYAKVTDNDTQQPLSATTDNIPVPVDPLNEAPVIQQFPSSPIKFMAYPPVTTVLTTKVTDDGRPNLPGKVTTTWTQGSGPGTATFKTLDDKNTEATFPQAGTYQLTCEASDGEKKTSRLLEVTIELPDNTLPTVTITKPNPSNSAVLTLPLPGTIAIEAAATDPDEPKGKVVKVEFFEGGTPLGEDSTSPYQYSWAVAKPGAYTLKATATDDRGGTASHTVSIIVEAQTPKGTMTIKSLKNYEEATDKEAVQLVFTLDAQAPTPAFVQATNIKDQWSDDFKLSFLSSLAGWPLKEETCEKQKITEEWTRTTCTVWARLCAKGCDQPWGWSQPISDTIILERTPPSSPVVTDGGEATDSTATLTANWSMRDLKSFPKEYHYQIYRLVLGQPDPVTPWIPVLNTSVTRSDLTLQRGVTYYFAVKAINRAGSESEIGLSDGIRVTLEAPQITNVKVTLLSSTSVEVTWTTNIPATSQVAYGLPNQFSTVTPAKPEPTRDPPHRVPIQGLKANTDYQARALSINEDGKEAWSDFVPFKTLLEPNKPPEVKLGEDRTVTLPTLQTEVPLSGVITDDGLPKPPGALTFVWKSLSGPGTVAFKAPNQSATTATFPVEGTYELQVTAFDGEFEGKDTVRITVKLNQPPPPTQEQPPVQQPPIQQPPSQQPPTQPPTTTPPTTTPPVTQPPLVVPPTTTPPESPTPSVSNLAIAITSPKDGAVLGARSTNGRLSLLHEAILSAGGLVTGSFGGGKTGDVVTMVGDPLGIAAAMVPDSRSSIPWRVSVEGTISHDASVTLNDQPALVNGKKFRAEGVTLSKGRNRITAKATDPSGRSADHAMTVIVPGGPYPPMPTLESPATVVTDSSLTLKGTKTPGTSIWVVVEDATGSRKPAKELVGRDQTTAWQTTMPLTEGDNVAVITARNDKATDNESAAVDTLVILDKLPPVISNLRFLDPDEQELTRDSSKNLPKTNVDSVTVVGAVDDSLTTVEANGVRDTLPGRAFRMIVPLATVGSHTVKFTAISPNKLSSAPEHVLLRGTIPTITTVQPPTRSKLYVRIVTPIQVTTTDPEGDQVKCQALLDGRVHQDWTACNALSWTPIESQSGLPHTLEVQARDGFGGKTSQQIRVYVLRQPIVPPAQGSTVTAQSVQPSNGGQTP